jgi:hypothetical protein
LVFDFVLLFTDWDQWFLFTVFWFYGYLHTVGYLDFSFLIHSILQEGWRELLRFLSYTPLWLEVAWMINVEFSFTDYL